MGAGASSMNRLRKAILIRAYNVRCCDDTLEEQFRKYAYRVGDTWYISIDNVKTMLSTDAPWVDDLFRRSMGGNSEDFEFSDFMDFLETGKLPLPPGNKIKNQTSKDKIIRSFEGRVNTDPPQTRRKPFPPTPPRNTPRQTFQRADSFSRYIPAFDHEYSTMYPGVIRALGLRTLATGIHNGALVTSAGLGIALSARDGHRPVGPTKPLWRKREIVKQERIIQYTTVDETGATQELVEQETSQTEVLHMECRETGEFAHRETTDYAHLETFNNEVVHEQTGKEEYVHLKSTDDEFEYMESDMPKREAPAQEDPSRATADEEDLEGLESPNGRAHPAPVVEVNVDVERDVDDDEEEEGGVHKRRGKPSPAHGLGGNGSKPDFYDEEGGMGSSGMSPGGGMWQSMGGNGWVPPPSSHDGPLGTTSLSEDDVEDTPHGVKYEEPAGRRRPDLFASDWSPVGDASRRPDSKVRGGGADVWTAEDDGEDSKTYKRSASPRWTGSSKELSSSDFRDPDDVDIYDDHSDRKDNTLGEDERLMGGYKTSGRNVTHVDYDTEEEGQADGPTFDDVAPNVVRWGTEDDID